MKIYNDQESETNISLIHLEYKEDPFAYKTALLYFIANGVSAAMSTTLSPLSTVLTQDFQISEGTVWYLNSSFTLHFLFFNSLANYFIDKHGVRKSLLLGVILTMVGSWLRIYIGESKLTWIIFGHTIIAIGGPFITNVITRISNLWFMQKNRTKMTSLMSSSYMFGLGLGFMLTSLLWNNNNNNIDNINNQLEINKSSMKNLMLYSAIISTLLGLPVCFYFKESPEVPPSLSANSERHNFFDSLKELVKHKDYNILLLVFSVALGNFITMVLMIHHVIAPFNFSIHQISNIGLIINFSSGTSKGVIAFIAPHFKLRKIIFSILILLVLCTVLFITALNSGNLTFVYFSAFFYGLFCQMYWGPALEYACEIAFPVSESHATGNLLFGGCIMGLITNYFVSVFYGEKSPVMFLIYLLISYAGCAGLINLMSDQLKREEFELNKICSNN
jgi:MFS transporter, FLVCR family, feline leukemia virus subgroup C receptor-related protein